MPETTTHTEHPIRLPQFLWRLFIAVLIWLVINLVIFVFVSFITFSLLSSPGMADQDRAFTLALACAIPSALTVSSLVAVRKLIPTLWRQNHV
jgi:hypothetical protein